MKFLGASAALVFVGLSGLSSAAYSLTDNYVANNFFSQFKFYTGDDPTHGFVNYVDQSTAQSQGLINTNNNKVYIGVDSKTKNPSGRGRSSVRLESKKQFTHGLFVLDLNHMPGSICGVWPAFWTYGPSWPNSGEIDILEGVNTQNTNFVTLHTGGVCKATNGGFNGQLTSTDCSVSTGGGSGCSIHSTNTATYGNGLNNAGGGVYAMEWLSSGIKVWFFPRNKGIPSDISSGRPNPSTWGTPMAAFPSNSNCNTDANFRNHWVTFDTTFCGDWAGAADVWNNNAECRSKAASCQAFVAGNPAAFQQAYWEVNSLKIYQNSGTASVSSSSNNTGSGQPVGVPAASSMGNSVLSSIATPSPSSIANSFPSSSAKPMVSSVAIPVASPIATATVGNGQQGNNNQSGKNGGWGPNGGHGGSWRDPTKDGNTQGGHDWSEYHGGHGHQKRHAHVHGAHGRRVQKQF